MGAREGGPYHRKKNFNPSGGRCSVSILAGRVVRLGVPKREISKAVCANPTLARYSQRMLGRRAEPVTCGASIRSEVGGVYEYATDV